MNGLSREEAQDVLSMAEILEISGLDMMQGILEGIYPAAPIAEKNLRMSFLWQRSLKSLA